MCIHRRVTHRCLVRAAHRLSNCLNVFRRNRLYVVTTRRFVLGVFATRRKPEENREETERSELSPLAIVRMRVSSRVPIVEQGRSGAVEKDRRERRDRRRRRREQAAIVAYAWQTNDETWRHGASPLANRLLWTRFSRSALTP